MCIGEVTMPKDRASIEITRSAYAEVEAAHAEQGHGRGHELLEEGEIQGWEEDIPSITLEGLPEADA
jgi:hypothetical protein